MVEFNTRMFITGKFQGLAPGTGHNIGTATSWPGHIGGK